MSDLEGVQIIYSDAVPPGTFLLGPQPTLLPEDPITFRRDPWGLADYPLSREGEYQRRRGLDFLAARLDRLCTDWGMSPDVWREPRLAEQWRRQQYVYMAEARAALTIVDPRRSVMVTNVS